MTMLLSRLETYSGEFRPPPWTTPNLLLNASAKLLEILFSPCDHLILEEKIHKGLNVAHSQFVLTGVDTAFTLRGG